MSAEKQLAAFLRKYSPAIAKQGRAAIATLRKRHPGASLLVYDNYNALAIAFSASTKPKDILFSIALYPRWVSLFLMDAKRLKDPEKILKGSGKIVRHVVLGGDTTLEAKSVRALLAQVTTELPPRGGKVIIQSISAKQRPRRPA